MKSNENCHPFCKTACASKSVLKFQNGSIAIFELSPFKQFFEEFPDMTPEMISDTFMQTMDMLITSYNPQSGTKVEDLQYTYTWLKVLRDVTSQIQIKRISSKKFEEMSRLDVTKEELYRAG